MAGSQNITLWGPQRTPLGVLRVKKLNGVEENSIGSKFPTSENFDDNGEINRASRNSTGKFTTSVQKCIGYD